MSKRTALIIIIVATLLLIGGLIFFYLYYGQGQSGGGETFPATPASFPTQGAANRPAGGNTTASSTNQTATGNRFAPTLTKLTSAPTGGATIVEKDGGFAVRFVDRGTGNVSEVSPDGATRVRLTNTTLPKVYESFWRGNGNSLILRYPREETESIASFYGAVEPKTGAEGELKGSFLTENAEEMAASPDGENIFYLLNRSLGSSGVIAKIDGSRRVQIFDSPLQELVAAWPTPTAITLTTKATVTANGLLYFLNAKTGAVKKILSGVAGLTTLASPDGSAVLYSESRQGGFSLKLYSLRDGYTKDVSVDTLPEKCVWSKDSQTIYCAVPREVPQANYPDSWYQGVVSFSDELWKVDADTGAGQMALSLRDYARQDIDAVRPSLNRKENYLLFTNKNDLTLWGLRFRQ